MGYAAQQSGQITLLTTVHFEPIVDSNRWILKQLDKITSLCSVLASHYDDRRNKTVLQLTHQAHQHCYQQLEDKLSSVNFKKQYAQLERQTKSLEMIFANHTSRPTRALRARRSWIPILGRAYWHVFGLQDEIETTKMNKTIQALQQDQKKLLTHEKETYGWINNVFSQLQTDLKEANINALALVTNVTRTLRDEIEQTRVAQLISDTVTQASLIMIQVVEQNAEIFALLDYASQGRIYEPMVDLVEVFEQLRHIETTLGANTTIPFSRDVLTLLKCAQVEYYLLQYNLVLEISYPITTTNSLGHINKYIPIAQKSGVDTFYYYPIDYPIYIENTNENTIQGYTTAEFDHACRKLHKQLYICETHYNIKAMTVQKPTDLDQKTPKIFQLRVPFIVETGDQEYIIYGPENGQVTLVEQDIIKEIETKVIYQCHCGPDCILHAGGRTLKPRETTQQVKDIVVENEFITNPVGLINFTIPDELPDVNFVELQEGSNDPFERFSSSLKSQPDPNLITLSDDAEQLDLLEYLPHTNLGLTLFVLGIVIVLYMYVKCQKQNGTNIVVPQIIQPRPLVTLESIM